MSGRRLRVDRLEAVRAAWAAEHVPLADLLALLREVLAVVEQEAGPGAAGQVAGRMVAAKLQQVNRLSGGQP
ncbi:hypothetical protein [Deinococcus sonorensis]|uniref:Uncharacterized protein n=2 Tax=Deinococcus sonorensis TaxID=309891 RepID=A0AAU7UBW1_9DEIO